MENRLAYYPPKYITDAFNCPYCNVYAHQFWDEPTSKLLLNVTGGVSSKYPGLAISLCKRCNKYCIWQDAKLLSPDRAGIKPPNEDLTDDIVYDYEEAAIIVQKSPRGAAALLRLAIQKLCVHLGGKGAKIDEDIAFLVKRGLPVKIQQALDIVRVIGNESVHPGTIDLKDDAETAISLFGLINLIAEKMITEPKHIDAMYDTLPESKRKAIEKRDGKP